MEQKIMEYVEKARTEYFKVINKPERYRGEHELAKAEAKLIQIECLAMDLGLIETGTI